MRVLFAASELTPIAKVGGLGDVIASLPKALARQGVAVTVALPFYAGIDRRAAKPVRVRTIAPGTVLYQTRIPGSRVTVLLIWNKKYLSTGPIYFSRTAFAEHLREIERFRFFSKTIFELIRERAIAPNIVHCHDWHTGLLVSLVAQMNAIPPKVVYTIHNLANQGKTRGENLMADGIRHADSVTTVSPTYAKEIRTKAYGEGLERLIRSRARQGRLTGILNGIDYDFWNPQTDQFLPAQYSAENLDGKFENKVWLIEELGLHSVEAPLVGLVSRLTDQKGIDFIPPLVTDAIERHGCQFVFLGQGAPKYEAMLRALARRFPAHISTAIGFDERLAHRIYAASDLFLMPSRFEPCGLGQMIAMRYGAIPIVRKTGGLNDTVRNGRTGFVFRESAAAGLGRALEDALRAHRDEPRAFRRMQRACLASDFSFDRSARAYWNLYRKLTRSN